MDHETEDTEVIKTNLFSLGIHKFVVGEKAIQPLLAFSSLIHVCLDPVGGFDLNNATVKKIALAWPCIQSLLLGNKYPSCLAPHVTMNGLLPIAEYCLNISYLSITFDMSISMEGNTIPQLGEIHNMCLTRLNVGSSTIKEPLLVASFILHVFPAFRGINILVSKVDDKVHNLFLPQVMQGKAAKLIPVFACVHFQEKVQGLIGSAESSQ
jgi:hypothetical protein